MKKRLDSSLMRLLGRQFVEFGHYYFGAIICLFFTHYIQSKLPFYAKELADIVQTGADSIDTKKFFFLALGIIVFRTSSRLLFFYPARVMQKNLRVELLSRLERALPARYREYSSGQLFQVLGSDMEEIRAMIGFALLQVGNIVVAMSVLIPKVMSFNENLVIALLPLLLAFLLFTYIVSKNRHYYRKTQDLQGEVQNFIMESYVGKKTIKNYHAEKAFIELFKAHSFRELINFYKAGARISFAMPFVPLGVGISLLWGAHIIKVQDLGASSLVLFSGFVFLFLEPLMFLSWIGVVFTRSHGAWARIRELVKTIDTEAQMENTLVTLNESRPNFLIPFWEKEIEMDLKKGQWSVLIGKTGCGKSELMNRVATVLAKRKENMSYVAQAPYLYNDSLLANIFLGQEPTVDKIDEAYELLKLFGLDYLANDRDSLLSMEVGENGKRLSGGQQKRLCLIRSLMSGAETILWDDPFSSVDLILEKQIVTKLRQMEFMKDKTILLSSHRLSTVRMSDEVVYLEKDEGIIERVNVNQLTEKNYAGKVLEYFENQMV
ncbi:ABC transporter ATP-binding protein [Halobacteriovorax sp. GB3]|uniref:ABC transporter transmembrane domain-containing protein n=1 Tax=Halobacteriovorax sp. GB3 TaxID=2719615 RepID=UPI002361FD74|nr:ABC transporter ATP-binding protein [Halobacteriovorax sp. GB3]MDD0853656.1 ABC transporter ATP-binding protein [Halobacteriovorax sp. GB3]